MKLNNGVEMPELGLGTYLMSGKDVLSAVKTALKLGYTHFDTASFYGNEKELGQAIKGMPRDNLFVTTKIWVDEHDDPRAAFGRSLKRLGAIDLYLNHWPVPQRLDTWKLMEQLYEEGKCRAIGVSNFTIRHLKELLTVAHIVPAVNQVEFHPWLYQKELLEFCKENDIQLVAYSPLVRGKKFQDKRLLAIAEKYHRSPAQILIRWCLQHGVIAIPKSTNPERIRENFDVDFKIDAKDMRTMDSWNEDHHMTWDPTDIP